MSQKFIDGVIDEINKFRANPKSIEKKIETFRLGLSRLRGNESFAKEVDKFLKQLHTLSKMKMVTKNLDLTDAAEQQIELFEKQAGYQKYISGNRLRGKIPEAYLDQNCCLIANDGAETPADVVTNILLNKLDKERIGRTFLTNNEYTQVGVGYGKKDDDNYVIVILAKTDASTEAEVPEGDLSELKQAFDLFDVNKIGKIDPKETVAAMRSLNFDMKNPELFKIMKELDTPENNLVDYPTFAAHIVGKISDKKTEAGLRTIFNLFVDDPSEDVITILTLKRIVKDLGETESEEEINRLLSNKGGANAVLTFQEFVDFMKKNGSS